MTQAAIQVATPWTRDVFEQKLRDMERYYHIHHEFHVRMNSGKLDKKAIQGWVANRFYYQTLLEVDKFLIKHGFLTGEPTLNFELL